MNVIKSKNISCREGIHLYKDKTQTNMGIRNKIHGMRKYYIGNNKCHTHTHTHTILYLSDYSVPPTWNILTDEISYDIDIIK